MLRLKNLGCFAHAWAQYKLVNITPSACTLAPPRPTVQNVIEGVGVDEVGGRGDPADERVATFR
eukprot:8529969-Pyramimonas_sp.AAC.1